MNEWPDELWRSELSHTRDTPDQFASDVALGTDHLAFTTESIVPWVVIGASLTLCCSVVMGLAGVMVGASTTLIWLRRKGIGFARVVRHTT